MREVEAKETDLIVEVSIWTSKNVDVREQIFEKAVESKWKLIELTMPKRSLEEVFVQVTHHED